MLILAADDDADIRMLVQRRLERRGWEVIVAVDGDEALALARQRLPAALVLDSSMPGLTGEQVVAALRAEPATARIPAILLTSHDAAVAEEEADERMVKPFDIDALDGALRRITGERGSAETE